MLRQYLTYTKRASSISPRSKARPKSLQHHVPHSCPSLIYKWLAGVECVFPTRVRIGVSWEDMCVSFTSVPGSNARCSGKWCGGPKGTQEPEWLEKSVEEKSIRVLRGGKEAINVPNHFNRHTDIRYRPICCWSFSNLMLEIWWSTFMYSMDICKYIYICIHVYP